MSKEQNKWTRISHAEAIMNPEYASYCPEVSITRPIRMLSQEDTVVNNRIVKKSCWKEFNPAEHFRGMLESDYALENIIAAGAVGALREGKVSLNSGIEQSDSFDGALSNWDAAMQSEQQNNNEQTQND